ncbi:MAG: hypothetical protein E7296_08725 [Lachnospiraceae bacterium]|jgi:hypothetical protein|nr:hypothetical protein [Lachnospiraceae bacterium]
MTKDLKENKVAFIICYNNDLILNECKWYLERINIPEGVEYEIIPVHNPPSMCAGYNAAMSSSDAKYKVYLHQDVFILNTDFIWDMMVCFEQNQNFGMLGVIGGTHIPENGSAWDSWNVGITDAVNWNNHISIRLAQSEDGSPIKVEAIDGMLMVTNTDVDWRADVFDGYDFYDISQCMEFRNKGLDIGVVYQKSPWCLHDCGKSKLIQYDHYRELFCRTYGFNFDCYYTVNEETSRVYAVAEKILDAFDKTMSAGLYDKAYELLGKSAGMHDVDNRLEKLLVIHEMCELGQGMNSFIRFGQTAAEMIATLDELKFKMWRVILGDEDAQTYIGEKIESGFINQWMLQSVSKHYV